MKTWPKSFPTPTIQGYSVSVDMGLTRVKMDRGNIKQRRRYIDMPSSINIQLAVNLTSLKRVQQWINSFGYEWFTINLTSYLGKCVPHKARFASDLNLTPINDNAFILAAVIEVVETGTIALLTDVWVIAGNPASPSVDVIIAGSPSTPSSPDVYVSGDPSSPAAYV